MNTRRKKLIVFALAWVLFTFIAKGNENAGGLDIVEDGVEDIFSELTREMERRAAIEEMLNKPYPIRKRLNRNEIIVRHKTMTFESGQKATLIYGRHKKAKLAPAVFVIDVEAASLSSAPKRTIWGQSKRKENLEKKARYLWTSPFGSNLLAHGFLVAYLVTDDLATLRKAKIIDWLDTFDTVRDLKPVEPNSLFLLSTKEYANLSLYLAARYAFAGFVLEEPQYMLFSRRTYEHIIERSHRLSEEEIWRRTDPTREEKYRSVLSDISSPILLIRSEDNSAFEFNEKTLIPKLLESNTYFETLTLERQPRWITTFGGERGVMNITPEVRYDVMSISEWLEGMITYFKMNSSVDTVSVSESRNRASFASSFQN